MSGFVRRAIRRLLEVRKRFGVRAVCRRVVNGFGKRLVGLSVLQGFWLERERMVSVLPADEGFQFEFLSLPEVERFQRDRGNHLAPEFLVRARERGDLCFAALSEGRLANFGWFALDGIEKGPCCDMSLSMPADAAYMYNAFTHPDFRGHRLHAAATELALAGLAERGVTRLFLMVDWTNEASLRSYSRMGAVQVGRIVTIGWGRWKHSFYPRAAQQRGVRFGLAARPVNAASEAKLELVETALQACSE